MSRRLRWILPVVLIAAGIPMATARTASAQTPAACPTGVTLAVAPPTAAAPTTVTVTVTPAQNIKPASAADATSFHLHYFVDTPAAAAGAVIPTGDPKIIHGTATQDLGPLAAGSHTVVVVLGQLNHTACDTRATVTFTSAAPAAVPAAAPAPAKTGDAGLAGEGTDPVVLMGALLGAALLFAAGARKVTGRRR